MNEQAQSTRNTVIILLLTVIAVAIYLLSIKLAYPILQNSRLTDPLASLHSLSPLYYLAIAIIALAGFICFISDIKNKVVHLLLLITFALMLWYTPYYLAGFTYQPDGPWHVGVALHIPEVLAGEPVAFSYYAQIYPGSFIFHWLFLNILGIEPLGYISRFFPLLCPCLFLLLCYAFMSRLFNPRVALLSLLLAIPGLHYIQLHPCPHSIGALLVLTALVLLLKRGVATRALMILAIVATIGSHPISPLLLLVFLGTALITGFSTEIGMKQLLLATLLLLCFVGWFYWPILPLVPEEARTASGHATRMIQSIFPGGLPTSEQYLLGTPFIHTTIYNLNKGIYFLYATIAAVLLLHILVSSYLQWRNIKRWASKLGGLSRSQIFLTLSLPLFFILALLLAEQAHDLIERSLTFIILALSCITASAVIKLYGFSLGKKTLSSMCLVLILFLTLSFPIVSYSIDAYTSFPESEETGLEFLAVNALGINKTLAGTGLDQLALYMPYFQPAASSEKPHTIILRSTGYYYQAMRWSLSFDDNQFTRYRQEIKNDSEYDKIYGNSTTEIYQR